MLKTVLVSHNYIFSYLLQNILRWVCSQPLYESLAKGIIKTVIIIYVRVYTRLHKWDARGEIMKCRRKECCQLYFYIYDMYIDGGIIVNSTSRCPNLRYYY